MKTLIDIVTPLVHELVKNDETFSAHDVTKETRKAVNLLCKRENLSLPAADTDAEHVYEINHDEVKSIVQDMYKNGEIDRVFNGEYFVYHASNVNVPAPAPVPKKVINSCVDDVIIQSCEYDLADRIYKYISRNGARSLTHIQGNVCRHDPDNRSNITIIRTVLNDDRLTLIDDATSPSYWKVDVVS